MFYRFVRHFIYFLMIFGIVNVKPSSAQNIDLSSMRIIDLSYSFNSDTIYWPTSPSTFQLKQLHKGPTEAGFYYSSNSFCTPEHGGTHLDAPVHFAEGAWSSAEIPADRFVGPAVVIDVSAQAEKNPDYILTIGDLKTWETKHGRIPAGAIVMLRTGWGKHWPDRMAYLGDDKLGDASNLHFPSYGPEAANMLIKERKVSIIGVDTASIDNGPSRNFPVHQIAGAANVPGLENLANLDKLPPTGAWIIALPMKIAGGSGGPARIIAFVPRR